MLTIAGGLLLAVALIYGLSIVLAMVGVPVQLFFEHRKFVRHKKLPVRYIADTDDAREGSEY